MKTTKSFSCLVGVLFLTLAYAATAVGQVPAVVVGNPAIIDGHTDDVVGFVFNVGNQPISVSELGFWDEGSNGLNSAHDVAIFRQSDRAMMVRGTVARGVGSPLDGGFRYVSVPETILEAGEFYQAVAYRPSGGADRVGMNFSPFSPAPEITIPHGILQIRPGRLVFATINRVEDGLLGANFKFGAVQTDCNANGVLDRDEIATGTTIDGDANGVPDECEPHLVGIINGAAAGLSTDSLNTFISPRSEDVPLNEFTLEATEDLELLTARSTYTGPISTGGGRRGSGGGGGLARAPEVTAFTNDGDGRHTVTFAPAPEPGQWLKLTLFVRGQSPSAASFNIWLAHRPCDQDQSGDVTISDATAYGNAWRMIPSPLELVDHDGDGIKTISDASDWAASFNGLRGRTMWDGATLPAKPE